MAASTPRGVSCDATIVDGDAHAIVAHAMGTEPAPLGLDRPLALLGGGDRLAPSGMASAPGIDHVPGLREYVADACRRSAAAGGLAYRQPPLALLGERGVGKGFVASWIARQAGLPLLRMRMDAAGASLGLEPDPTAMPMPPFPIVAIASSRCANPIVAVELDADHPPSAAAEDLLVSMIDPKRCSRWMDGATNAIVDLGNVSWILEVHGRVRRTRTGVNDSDISPVLPAMLPAKLEALVSETGTILHLSASGEDAMRRLDVATSVCAAAGLDDPGSVSALVDALLPLRGSEGSHVTCEYLVRVAVRHVVERSEGRRR